MKKNFWRHIVSALLLTAIASVSMQAAHAESRVESAFSPDAGSEALVLKVIRSAKSSIRLAAYTFTSPAVVRALLDAKKRGVDVRIVVDDKGNHSAGSQAALNLIASANIPVRTIAKYAIRHDKFIVVDQ